MRPQRDELLSNVKPLVVCSNVPRLAGHNKHLCWAIWALLHTLSPSHPPAEAGVPNSREAHVGPQNLTVNEHMRHSRASWLAITQSLFLSIAEHHVEHLLI